MIVVIDYNVGNVKSVCNAFRHIGCDVELSCTPEAVKNATFGLSVFSAGSSNNVPGDAELNRTGEIG